MIATQRQSKVGLAVSIGALFVLIAAALLIQVFFISPTAERGRASLAVGMSLQTRLLYSGPVDSTVHKDIQTYSQALREGGQLFALDGQRLQLPASGSQNVITSANTVEQVSKLGGTSQVADSFAALLQNYRQETAKRSQRVLWFQSAVIINALFLLAFIFSQFFHRLRRANLLWNATLRENKSILEATKDGLFLIKPSLQVGSVQSGAVQRIFGISQPIAGNFFDFLKRLVSTEDLDDAKEYISLMLEGRGKQSLLSDLNPLKEIEVMVENSMGFVANKYLSFDFARNELNPAAGLLVSVSDITKEVELKRELVDASKGNEERFHLLMGSIVNDSEEVDAFYQTTHEGLREINDLLRDDNQEHDDNVHKLEDIFRTVHDLKGNAGAVGVSLIETSAHQFESKIQELLELPNVSGEQILSLTVHLKHMISELNFLEQLSAKFDAKQSAVKPKLEAVPASLMVDTEPLGELERLTQEVAGRQGKMVSLEKIGFDQYDISDAALSELNSLCIQLIRNSIVHGIEAPEVRRQREKASEGRIIVTLRDYDEERVLMTVKDDGAGFNFDAIKVAAVARKLTTPEAVEKMSKSELVRFIFVSGFSTQEDASIDAGRGVGLDIVKATIARLEGKISVKSSRGVSAQVSIRLPKTMLRMESSSQPEVVLEERANAL